MISRLCIDGPVLLPVVSHKFCLDCTFPPIVLAFCFELCPCLCAYAEGAHTASARTFQYDSSSRAAIIHSFCRVVFPVCGTSWVIRPSQRKHGRHFGCVFGPLAPHSWVCGCGGNAPFAHPSPILGVVGVVAFWPFTRTGTCMLVQLALSVRSAFIKATLGQRNVLPLREAKPLDGSVVGVTWLLLCSAHPRSWVWSWCDVAPVPIHPPH